MSLPPVTIHAPTPPPVTVSAPPVIVPLQCVTQTVTAPGAVNVCSILDGSAVGSILGDVGLGSVICGAASALNPVVTGVVGGAGSIVSGAASALNPVLTRVAGDVGSLLNPLITGVLGPVVSGVAGPIEPKIVNPGE